MTNNGILTTKLNHYFKDNIKLNFTIERSFDRKLVIVTKCDKVYKFAPNISAQICLTTNIEDIQHEVESAKVDELSGKQVDQFLFGLNYIIARTLDGKIYSCMETVDGDLLDNISDEPMLNEYFANNNSKITVIKCGNGFAIALTNTGHVFTWGWNLCEDDIYMSYSDLPHLDESYFSDSSQTMPIKLNGVMTLYGYKIVMISCGAWYSLALDEKGLVYSWRSREAGHKFEPYRVGFNRPYHKDYIKEPITKICCGKNHSLLLSNDGDIYAFGSRFWGQLGDSCLFGSELTAIPKKIIIDEKFKDIAANNEHDFSAALSINDVYYVWGKCGIHNINSFVNYPKATQFTSFNQIFNEFCVSNNIRVFDGIIDFEDNFIHNGKFDMSFEVIKEIGSGSYGTVSIVKNNIIEYAIKIIKFNVNDKKINSILSELRMCSLFKKMNTNDKGVAKYYDEWLEKGYTVGDNGEKIYLEEYLLYIQMELCDTNLKAIIKQMREDIKLYFNGKLTLLGYYISSELFIELLESIDFLHKQKIIHRDLKPDNILLKISSRSKRFVKVADFGLSVIHEFAEQSHTIDPGAAVRYAAPETIRSDRTTAIYNEKSDIYSLGEILRDLFDIDINSNEFYCEIPLLKDKYNKASDLSIDMKVEVYGKRPDCETILKDIRLENSMALIKEHFDDELNAELVSRLSEYIPSSDPFIYQMIKIKLNDSNN